MIDPYKLMLHLRDNKILFKYLEDVCIIHDDDNGWSIKGNSNEGSMYVYNTASGILRFVIPIPVPKEIPMEAIYRVTLSAQSSLDGILGILTEKEDTYIEYYIHSNVYDGGLDNALIRFLQERKELLAAFEDIKNSIKNIMSSMNLVGMPIEKVIDRKSKESTNTGENLWNTMNEIDKKDIGNEEDDVENTEDN